MHLIAALLQSTSIPDLGIGVGAGGLAGVVFYFYRQDRKANETRLSEIQAENAKRMDGVLSDFRSIIEANTKAMTALTDQLASRTVQCPMVAQEATRRGGEGRQG